MDFFFLKKIFDYYYYFKFSITSPDSITPVTLKYILLAGRFLGSILADDHFLSSSTF